MRMVRGFEEKNGNYKHLSSLVFFKKSFIQCKTTWGGDLFFFQLKIAGVVMHVVCKAE